MRQVGWGTRTVSSGLRAYDARGAAAGALSLERGCQGLASWVGVLAVRVTKNDGSTAWDGRCEHWCGGLRRR